MASTQPNQRQVAASEHSVDAVVLYVSDRTDRTAFSSASLRDAGYDVHFAPAKDALAKIGQIKADVVVIGHGLSLPDRVSIEEGIRQLRPKPRVVLLYDRSIAQTEQADAVLNVNSGPQHLAQTIRYLLTGRD